MIQRNLQPALQVVSKEAVKFISEILPIQSVVLGGGTVLAARWHHRFSTDLDFFVDAGAIDSILVNPGRRNAVNDYFARLQEDHQIDLDDSTGASHDGIRFWISATPVSVVRQSVKPIDSTTEIESQTNVRLESSADILHKKLIGRLIGWGSLTPRDVYDVLVASNLDISSLERAHQAMNSTGRARLLDTLQALVEAPASETAENEAVIRPKYQFENMNEDLLELFSTDLVKIPVANQIRVEKDVDKRSQ